MTELTASGFKDLIAERIRAAHLEIATRWLDRLRALLPVDTNDIFPADQLLDHVPALVMEIADYLRSPEETAVAANTAVTEKARDLGALRHSQRASVHQLLSEYRILGGILSTFVAEQIEELRLAPAAQDVIDVFRRLQEATWLLQQVTVDTFVSEYTTALEYSASRLEAFNRLVSHELRQPLGTLQYAVPLLKVEVGAAAPRATHLLEVMERNVGRLVELTETLAAVARVTDLVDGPSVQRIEVAAVAREAARQLREMADARGVDLRVGDDLPVVVADAARLELILVNLLSNGIKYSDPHKAERYVVIERGDADAGHCAVAVRDNGLGIPAGRVETIFRRFVRAHTERDAELGVQGLGLGLSIVAECAHALSGGIDVRSAPGEGTTFVLTLPADVGQ